MSRLARSRFVWTFAFVSLALLIAPLTIYNGATSFPLIAIPLFILSGAIMNASGISRRLIAFASALLGWIRGGLAIVSIGTSMFFAEISGSAVADAAALGAILIPAMKSRGYSKEFAAAVISSSATLAVIIPPSIPMLLYAVIAETSVVKLFVSGHRARHHRRLRPDGRRLLVRASLQLSGRAVVPLGQRASGPSRKRCGLSCCRS